MTCRFCSETREDEVLAIVPEPPGQVNLSASPFAHIDCLEEKGLYCPKHKKVHSSFTNGTACHYCIHETAAGLIPFANSIINRLREKLDPERWAELVDWATASVAFVRWPYEHAMMFAVATSFHVLRSQRENAPEGQLTNDNFSERLEFVLEAVNQTAEATFPF